MSEKNENQLSEHIKQVLHNHEEDYVLGSWERFQRHKNKKARIRKQRIFLAIAVSILFMVLSMLALMDIEFTPKEQVAEHQQTEQPDIHEGDSPLPSAEPEPTSVSQPDSNQESSEAEITEDNSNDRAALQEPVSEDNLTGTVAAISFKRKSVPQPSLAEFGHAPLSNTLERISDLASNTDSDRSLSSTLNNEVSGEFVENEDIPHSLNSSQQKDFVFSVAYASIMNIHDSQTDIGPGGGFYADWNFARNLTLSSGLFIAQNQLKYSGESGYRLMKFADEDGPTTLTGDDLASVQLDFVNLEIPLNVRYYITNHLSFSAGISSMAFLKEEYNYNFEYEQRIQVFENTETTGPRPTTKVVTMRTTQTQSEPSLERMNWAAFYTFSVGYQQEVFNGYTASFEPFVKIPAGQVSSRDISYTSGGIQLKISF